MTGLRPQRLNLSIARRCFVTCRGCYQFFGHADPDLEALAASVAVFVRLGVRAVTISGGDPLTLPDLPAFLARLRAVGMTNIKVDTVGTALLDRGRNGEGFRVRYGDLHDLLEAVDVLGLPLDGWSRESVTLFRRGRTELFSETIALMDAIDGCCTRSPVVVNTVVHQQNVMGLRRILAEVSRHRSVTHWNLFQYTPTDQVARDINLEFDLDERVFVHASADLLADGDGFSRGQRAFGVGIHTVRSRLGRYLLINSDGECWLPDASGRSLRLGAILGREEVVMEAWVEAVQRLCAEPSRATHRPRSLCLPQVAEVA